MACTPHGVIAPALAEQGAVGSWRARNARPYEVTEGAIYGRLPEPPSSLPHLLGKGGERWHGVSGDGWGAFPRARPKPA